MAAPPPPPPPPASPPLRSHPRAAAGTAATAAKGGPPLAVTPTTATTPAPLPASFLRAGARAAAALAARPLAAWSVEDCMDWVASSAGAPHMRRAFAHHRIDGPALAVGQNLLG